MPENFIKGCEPPLLDEIDDGLEELSKGGYEAHAHLKAEDLSIIFSIGESEQKLEFKKGEWRKEGVVRKAIVDHLNI